MTSDPERLQVRIEALEGEVGRLKEILSRPMPGCTKSTLLAALYPMMLRLEQETGQALPPFAQEHFTGLAQDIQAAIGESPQSGSQLRVVK